MKSRIYLKFVHPNGGSFYLIQRTFIRFVGLAKNSHRSAAMAYFGSISKPNERTLNRIHVPK